MGIDKGGDLQERELTIAGIDKGMYVMESGSTVICHEGGVVSHAKRGRSTVICQEGGVMFTVN